MKVSEFEAEAKDQLKDKKAKAITTVLTESMQCIEECEMTLQKLKESHQRLLDSEVDSVLLDHNYEF